MSAAASFASQFVNDRIPARAAVPFTRRVGRAFRMIGLMLAGAWPETRMIRLRVAAGAVNAPGR
ncbi:MAG TPA: hypothetical protein VLG93_08725 [Sulfuricaulis sp.]|nr:hypothetical protein [Sulfuricaulis sp.]